MDFLNIIPFLQLYYNHLLIRRVCCCYCWGWFYWVFYVEKHAIYKQRHFMSCFPIYIPFTSFPFFIASAKTSKVMSNRNVERGHPFFTPILRGKIPVFSSLDFKLSFWNPGTSQFCEAMFPYCLNKYIETLATGEISELCFFFLVCNIFLCMFCRIVITLDGKKLWLNKLLKYITEK